MRITERMGLVYTALFLTVSVAVITQNSDVMIAMFRGESTVVAADDIFTVQPGKSQRLAVLANDVPANQISPAMIRVNTRPACGTVQVINGNLIYSKNADCAGTQSFRYCLQSRTKCSTAKVVLRIDSARAVVNSIVNGPATVAPGLDMQAKMNSKDLEITNVRLGKSAAREDTIVSVGGMKLAKVAVEPTAAIIRPAQIVRTAKLAGTFTLNRGAAFGRDQTVGVPIKVATIGDIVPPITSMEDVISVDLPHSPTVEPLVLGVGIVDRKALVRHLSKIDLTTRPLVDRSAIDNSPFGTACGADLTSAIRPGAMVELSLSAPCYPNTRVEIFQGKLVFAALTGHTGNLTVAIPALEKKAVFMVRFPDGTTLRLARIVEDLDHFERVAVQWNGPVELDLHAYEFGATDTADGHVWAGHTRTPDLSHQIGGGFTTLLGDASVDHPMLAQVYSLPIDTAQKSGVVRLAVKAADAGAFCGHTETLLSHYSKAGRIVGSAGYRVKMPACGTASSTLLLNNAVRDLIIARN